MSERRFLKVVKTFSDPDELTEIVSRDLREVVYTGHDDALNFHLDFNGVKTADMMIWATHTNSGYHAMASVADNITFEFVELGQLQYLPSNGAEIQAQVNQVSVSRRSQQHKVICAPDTRRTVVVFPWERYANLVAPDTNDPSKEFRHHLPVINLSAPEGLLLKNIASILPSVAELSDVRGPDSLSSHLLKEAFLEVFLAFWPQLGGNARILHVPSPWHVKRAVDWIYEHLREKILLEDLATASGASIRTLQIGFRETFGLTPIGFIRQARLQNVHKELQTLPPHITINEIASRWGFASIGQFAVRYKALYGCSPSATRRNARAN